MYLKKDTKNAIKESKELLKDKNIEIKIQRFMYI